MKKCIICGSNECVEMHHMIPQLWFEKYSEEMIKKYGFLREFTIPLCHFHHWMIPPFICSTYARKLKGVTKEDFRNVIRILNKKFYPRFGFKLLIHKYKNGNQDIGIYLAEVNKKKFVIK